MIITYNEESRQFQVVFESNGAVSFAGKCVTFSLCELLSLRAIGVGTGRRV